MTVEKVVRKRARKQPVSQLKFDIEVKSYPYVTQDSLSYKGSEQNCNKMATSRPFWILYLPNLPCVVLV